MSILIVIIFILLGIIVYFLKNPEKVDKWSYLINKFLLWRTERREKKIISKGLDYRISSVAKKINNEANGIIPFGVRIHWKNVEEISTFVQKNNVIIVLKKEDNSDKNIIDACMAFVPQAVLPKARNVIRNDLINSIDYYLIKKILMSGNYDSAYNFFVKNVLDKNHLVDRQLKTTMNDLSNLDSIGFFTRVLLEEYRKLGNLTYGTSEEYRYKSETYDFFRFLKNLSQRSPGDDKPPLIFNGKRIKIAIIFVAKKATLMSWGVDAHLNRIKEDCRLGVQRIFVFSYAQSINEVIKSEEGYAISVKKRKSFIPLSQIERRCKDLNCIRLVKKQMYKTFDTTGRKRTAKFLLYEVIPTGDL